MSYNLFQILFYMLGFAITTQNKLKCINTKTLTHNKTTKHGKPQTNRVIFPDLFMDVDVK